MIPLSPPPGFGAPSQRPQLEEHKRSKDRRVSWATSDKLCQVRLFAAEDAPVLSGITQEQLQAKHARNMYRHQLAVPSVAPEDAPPGFGGGAAKLKANPGALALIVAEIPWRRADIYKPDEIWQVKAGDDSLEKNLQKEREFRVLEAVYPRPSSIPSSPAEPVEVSEAYDDTRTQIIPLVPLEDEDVIDGFNASAIVPRLSPQVTSARQVVEGQTAFPKAASRLSTTNLIQEVMNVSDRMGGWQRNGLATKESSWGDDGVYIFRGKSSSADHAADMFHNKSPSTVRPDKLTTSNQNGVEPDVAAAAAAAIAVMAKAEEAGSMIDNNLLIRLLKDPSLMQSLTSKQTFSVINSQLELSSSASLAGPEGESQKGNHTQTASSAGFSNHWATPNSGQRVAGGQDLAINRPSEGYVQSLDRFEGRRAPDERPQPLMVVPENGSSYSELAKERVGPGFSTCNGPPCSGNGGSHSSVPPGFGGSASSSSPLQGMQLAASRAAVISSARPLSRHDEQYFKNLIMQHGCKSADDDDHGRALVETQGKVGGLELSPSNRFGGEEEDSAGIDRRHKDSDRLGTERPTRPKSRKTCIYYGSSRGCRNGANCPFVHELSSGKVRAERVRSEPTLQYAKRLKVDE